MKWTFCLNLQNQSVGKFYKSKYVFLMISWKYNSSENSELRESLRQLEDHLKIGSEELTNITDSFNHVDMQGNLLSTYWTKKKLRWCKISELDFKLNASW